MSWAIGRRCSWCSEPMRNDSPIFSRLARQLVLGCLLSVALAVEPRDASAQTALPTPAEAEVATAPVEIDGRELFRVRGASSLPAGERAAMIRARIITAARDPSISLESLRIDSQPGMSRIMAGNAALVTLVDPDAAMEQLDRNILADVHLIRVRDAIAGYRD